MAKLIRKKDNVEFDTVTEYWLLDNGLELQAYFMKDNIDVTIASNSGDVSDQIYNSMKKQYPHKDIKLRVFATYSFVVKKEDLNEIMKAIEKIDTSKLSKGKTY